MRLRRLDLLRYGHLTDAVLDFVPGARLHVVLGANEAGKSTALSALGDALFGFPHRSPYGFLHDQDTLRVGFTLAARDGQEASFIRRKGRRDTLRDGQDGVLPDTALSPFLHGMGRERFEEGFGLDGARLRAGANALLLSGGEAGEAMLAGSGLTNLRKVLEEIDRLAREQHGSGHGRRALAEAVNAWRDATREMDDRMLGHAAWRETEQAFEDAEARLARAGEEANALAREASRLERVRRVAPVLAALDQVRAEMAELADTPRLPTNVRGVFETLTNDRRRALDDVSRNEQDARDLRESRDRLVQDGPILATQDSVAELVSRSGAVAQDIADLPAAESHLRQYRTRVADALAALGLDQTPEQARDAIPTDRTRRTANRLAQRHPGLADKVVETTKGLETARRRLEKAEAAAEAAGRPASPALLRRAVTEVRGLGPLDADLARARQAADMAERAVATALRALPLWDADATTLAAAPIPLAADAEAAAGALSDARASAAEAATTLARQAAELAGQERELAEIAAGGIVPTQDAIAEARARRDDAWRSLRVAWSADAASAYEALVAEADHLADRCVVESERVGAYNAGRERLRRLRTDHDAAVTARLGAEAKVGTAEAAWAKLWAPAGIEPGLPAAMAEWRRARTDVLRLADAATQRRQEAADLSARLDAARARLTDAMGTADTQDQLAAMLARAELQCEAAEAAEAAERHARRELEDARARMEEQSAAVATARADMQAWDVTWAEAVVALGLPATTGLEEAEAALAAWATIAEAAPAWRDAAARIEEMRRRIDGFETEVTALRARLREPPSEETATAAMTRLSRRLDAARQAEAEARRLTRELEQRSQKLVDARRRADTAEADLANLRVAAGAADDATLLATMERAARRDRLEVTLAELTQTLLKNGDGADEAALRVEADGVDPDIAAARVLAIQDEADALRQEHVSLSAERTRLAAELAAMRQGKDAAAKAQEAADALAAARAAAERYARLHAARVLLRAGIERFRKEQQGPLLRAAGGHLATLTAGRYERLIVDSVSEKPTLLAVRADGTECPVEALSEGTRDQLYLALRVAAIEAHAARAEPMPFIADDLLVNFDDVRAAAGLRLLGQLGASTQVVLFTHHQHIADCAAAVAGAAVVRM